MHVDLATPADVPRLAELLGVLFAQEAEFAPDRAAQERSVRAILAAPEAGSAPRSGTPLTARRP